MQSTKKTNIVNIIAILLSITAVFLTILFGHYVLKGEKFNFICLLIIAEILVPFFLSFERKKPNVREFVIIAVMCALAVSARLAFYAFPQFKPMGAIIIIAGICLGAEKGFIIGAVSALVSNMFFAHGSWTAFQMLGFGMVGLVSGLVFAKGLLPKNFVMVSIFGFFATIILYGGVANLSSLLYYPQITWELVYTTYIVYGLPYDLIHGISTTLFLLAITYPAVKALERIKVKYGIF